LQHADSQSVGQQLHTFIRELQPMVRSITGDGLRQTLRWIGQHIPLQIHEVPSGTAALDWIVPPEWNVREAYINGPDARRIVDLRDHPLHLMGYSTPVHRRMSLAELKPHLFSLPEHPQWIPYRTSYYEPNWGFCVRHDLLQSLPEGEYEVVIDSTLAPGALSYGECVIPGAVSDEVLFSCHCCHPGLCNDNLSGIVVATELAKQLAGQKSHYTYRFLFSPGTIGVIVWLSRNEALLPQIKSGLVLAMLGDSGPLTYKTSRCSISATDRAALRMLQDSGDKFAAERFSPYGYDERQFNSPGFNLPIGRLTRTPHGKFPEYHTSADNLDFVKPQALADSLEKLSAFVTILEGNRRYVNTQPKGEPQLGRRGLFRAIGGAGDPDALHMAMLWLLNQCDGTADLLDVARRSCISFTQLRQAADILMQHGLLIEKP
jgi:aminopeptidase-like protein